MIGKENAYHFHVVRSLNVFADNSFKSLVNLLLMTSLPENQENHIKVHVEFAFSIWMS